MPDGDHAVFHFEDPRHRQLDPSGRQLVAVEPLEEDPFAIRQFPENDELVGKRRRKEWLQHPAHTGRANHLAERDVFIVAGLGNQRHRGIIVERLDRVQKGVNRAGGIKLIGLHRISASIE